MKESEKFYIEVSLTVPVRYSDVLFDFIAENISNGLVLQEEDDPSKVGIRFYVSPADGVEFRTLIPAFLKDAAEKLGETPVVCPLTEKTIESVEWEDQYKASVKAVVVAGDVGIRPPWETASESVKYDIIIEPKMAFGTGGHETTRSCLALIRENLRPGGRFLDLGCGSGILSVLADHMGAAYIKAIDYDMDAVENTIENFRINRIKSPHDVIHGSIEACDNDAPYEFVCANIIKVTILQMLPRLAEITATGGKLVLSGLLVADAPEVIDKLRDLGLTKVRVHEDGEWRSLIVDKGGD